MPKFIDLTGREFGRLEVLERAENDKRGNSRWLCRCDCKNELIVRSDHLKSGGIKSCGCLNREITTKHGHAKNNKKTGFYQSWQDMIQRCINPNYVGYKYYGGNGITVCDEWLTFENFERDMWLDWKPGLTLEREKNWIGYNKKNCRWATRKEQSRNKRDTLYVPYEGKQRLFVELCEEYNMPYYIVYNRYYRLDWTLEEALTTPVKKYKKRSK